MIYETKGLTLEQVDELYAEVTGIWGAKNSVHWKPTVTFREMRASVAAQGNLAGKEGEMVHAEKVEGQHVRENES